MAIGGKNTQYTPCSHLSIDTIGSERRHTTEHMKKCQLEKATLWCIALVCSLP